MIRDASSISIKKWLPIFAVSLGVIVWAVMTWYGYHWLKSDLIQSTQDQITQDMAFLQFEMENELSSGNKLEAEQALTARGVNTSYRTLVAIDDQGVIMYSTRFSLKNNPAVDVIDAFDEKVFLELKKHNRSEVLLNDNKKIMTAYFPLLLERRANEIRPLRTGAIFLINDYEMELAQIWSQLQQGSCILALVIVFALLAFVAMTRRYINRPVQILCATAKSIADGNLGVTSRIQGAGEFVELSDAFNDMSQQLRQRYEQRVQAEASLLASEKLYRQLIESTAAVAWEFDLLADKFVYMSPQIKALTGYAAELWTDFAFWKSTIHPDEREEVTQYCQTETTQGKNHSIEYRIVTTTGKEVWVRDEIGLVIKQGKVIMLRGYFFDITNQKQTERALRRSQKMDAIGQLAGGVAHDFNNILGIISGNVGLLENDLKKTASDVFSTNKSINKRLNNINHSVQRATTLTQQILGFSRESEEQVKPTNINKVISDNYDLVTQSLTPEVSVEQHLSEDVWLTTINPNDFEDALINLTLNARDAMKGRGKLTFETNNIHLDKAYCSLNPDVTPGDYVQLVISDTGMGIPAALQDNVFEPFFTTKEQGKGTGLGLSMVFGFVKRSNGNIKIYSEENIGTTFRIYLPRAGNEVVTLEENPIIETSALHGQEKILVVDDETDLLDLVKETLLDLGYQVLTATNGEEAMTIFNAEPDIDLLFSDVVMPGELNGFQLAEKLVKERPQLKVLLTSGYTEKAIARNGQARFKSNILTKPYTLVGLGERLRQTLSQSDT